MENDRHPCPNCLTDVDLEANCSRCGRPQIQDPLYVDKLEGLAWDVVNAAHGEYGEGFRRRADSGTELERSIVRLADRLKHWHYEGDGCLNDD